MLRLAKYSTAVFLFLLSFSIFAVYIVPLTRYPSGGFAVSMMVNGQGPFLSEIDTGSTNFMVPGDSTVCPNCNANPGLSPSGALKKSFSIYYGSGRILHAKTYTTTVQPEFGLPLGPMPSAIQTLGVIVKASGNGNSAPVLGMAQPAGPMPNGLTTYMQSLMTANLSPDLGFMLLWCPRSPNVNGSEIVFGGIDPRLQNATPITVPLLQTQNHYVITPTTLGIIAAQNAPETIIGNFNPPNAKNNPGVVVDSGAQGGELPTALFNTLVLAMENAVVDNPILHNVIPTAFWKGEGVVLTQSQIAQLPTIVINFKNGEQLMIPPQSYLVSNTLIPNESVFKIKGSKGYTVFGDILLSAYAVKFDRSTESLSFYPNTGMCG